MSGQVEEQKPTKLYKQVWEKLKSKGKCEILAEPHLHKRIVKAVIKRKDLDLGYKLLLSNEGKKAKLEITYDGNKIIFVLKKSIGLGDL